ncbi:hypothetical protein [Streptomyces sp. NPDC002088]|uniref:hypothetical protein n=1 Tax=Streptomyces sp. NPDC002088 TaxID=3154665 RepID=UPI00332E2DF3
MNDRIHAGVSALAASFVGAAFLVRYAITGGQQGRHRARRVRPAEEYVPAHVLIPALAVHGPGWPTAAFRHCIGCHAEVPVVVHDGAHRCDAHGHVTITTTTGD